jgi:signal transduction histidine kinase
VLGTIYLVDEEGSEAFSDEDQKAVELLAQHAAKTIEHAKAYQQLRQEIRERKRAEAALRASEKERVKLRDEWTSIIAHDLRQPISAMHLNANVLALERTSASEKNRALDHLKASALQLHRMVGDLLEASKIEIAQLELRKSEIDLAKLLPEVIHRHFGDSTNRIKLRLARVPAISADPGRIEQILGNLLINAMKYSFANTEILVTLEAGEKELAVCVANQGVGLGAPEIRELFQRFQRAKSAKKARHPGLGLGLYIVRGLVEAHGGRVWAESVPGKTTRFCFALPCPHSVG